jgi:hypothetical protein
VWTDGADDLSWGYVDRDGVLALGPVFRRALSFFEGLAYVVSEDYYGYLDAGGIWRALQPVGDALMTPVFPTE